MPKKERIKGKRFYFLGIGGASMSALAKYIHCEGGEVFGYDAQLSARTEELARAGVEIYTSAAISETEKAFTMNFSAAGGSIENIALQNIDFCGRILTAADKEDSSLFRNLAGKYFDELTVK